ncbi:hypothetical protein C3747_14g42 [Trypanosoma cruzi]|uniref:Uncharacterized protein n=2 Tax=Trypanosoma cruzi TaxID=5693 RepID=Q4E643_TRYCC|nr:hypothetical protein, conserved [Trypanosoma cruzi]EAO00215.1 hypothetical protein, conserved [Trypanosoma cruzi]PWV18163.1 hypothetical protein C3747_14g42 [Trypanosoma cruzi]RNC48856.1 hypothetical protein TcCL_NonESM01131 [Trypanosoma cruzi]|eukprot:XP_822066.1 hypothetical protein [Trypanosoma cruzi strain CL Brener]
MAEAARTVRHYVSDCLQERHPYDAKKAFAGRPERDRGLVYSGMQPLSTDNWIDSLSDPTVGNAQRVRALRLLIAHSASQEVKITLLRKGIVPAVVAALNNASSAEFERQAFSLMRSLCVLPQGCRSVMEEGGLEAAIRSMHDRSNSEEREGARTMAVMVLYQISFNTAGVRWLMEADVPPGFELLDAPIGSSTLVVTKEDVIAALVFVIENDTQTLSDILLYAVTSLAQLTALTEGIFASLQGNAAAAASSLFRTYTMETSWLVEEEKIRLVMQLLTVIWNISLEQTGVDHLDELGVPDDLFRLFAVVYKSPIWLFGSLFRALTGALSAVYKLLSVKMRSLEPLDGEYSRIEVLYKFLRSINRDVSMAKHAKREPHPDLVAISKNMVLCTHFAAEVKAVRDFTHNYLKEMDRDGSTEGFYFRRQLFYSTKWEEEFDASV